LFDNWSMSKQLCLLPRQYLYEPSCILWCSLSMEGASGLGFVVQRDAPIPSKDRLCYTP